MLPVGYTQKVSDELYVIYDVNVECDVELLLYEYLSMFFLRRMEDRGDTRSAYGCCCNPTLNS